MVPHGAYTCFRYKMANTVLSPKQRLKLVERVFKEDKLVASACQEFGVSRFTFYKWAKRYDKSASRNQNLRNLADIKRRVKLSKNIASSNVVAEVKKIVLNKPSLSKYEITNELKKRLANKALGVHGVYNILKRSGLNTFEDRKKWQQFVLSSKRRTLTPGQRLEVIRRAEQLRVPIAQVCRDIGISRYTFYKWKRRWEKSSKNIDALRDRKPQYDRRRLRIQPELEKEILSIVIEFPNLSKYGIARRLSDKLGPVVGPHGVYNVLLRNGLNIPELRLAYSRAYTPEVSVKPGVSDRIRYVLEQFVTSLAPAPPPRLAIALAPAARTFFNFLKTFSITSIISSATIYSFLWWISLLKEQFVNVSIGLIFATVALFMGSIFFLYSLKYYITLAIVLSFSQQESSFAPSTSLRASRGRKGFLSWILGFANGGSSLPRGVERRGVGLTPNLEHITLKRYPKVSVHIPLYNEKNVVERAIKAATNFDYPGDYEVILCDDSTDETTQIIKDYLRMSNVKCQMSNGEGYTLTQAEVRPGVTLKHLHRTSRQGFKGGALRLALKCTDPKAEFVSVFDADFVPYPDTLELFLKYFQATAGSLDFSKSPSNPNQNSQLPITNDQSNSNLKIDQLNNSLNIDNSKIENSSRIAAVQGYQWHVLNKSENWITRGVRSEYAGSYVIERSGTEIYSGLKQISGAVYMIRRDVLDEVGWETSITEDFQLTLKLYEKGYKVVYTPYIQAPAECVSTLKRLIRQRMRWAEGHSNNIRKMFVRLLIGKWETARVTMPVSSKGYGYEKENEKDVTDTLHRNGLPDRNRLTKDGKRFLPSPLTLSEKLEFLYLSPYYLQAFFFLIGTFSWLISETIFASRLPFWTSLWGWSLVLTNLISLPLMNAVGLFLEESEERDYQGLASFIALSYILVPFQAYASLKGFLSKEEGPWFRTPKTGRITDIFTRGRFYRFISGILPGRANAHPNVATNVNTANVSEFKKPYSDKLGLLSLGSNSYLSLTTANSRFDSFKIRPKKIRHIGNLALSFLVTISILLVSLSPFIPVSQTTYASEPSLKTAQEVLKALDSDEITKAKNPSHKETIIRNATSREIDTPRVIVKAAKSGKQIEFIFHKEPRIRIKLGGREVEFETLSIGTKKVYPSKSNIYSNKEVVYEEVIEGVDLKYSIAGGVLVEEFILKQQSAASFLGDIKQSLKTVDVKVVSPNSNTFGFYTEEGEELFKLSQPFAKDANGEVNHGVNFSLEKESFGYKLIKRFDQNFTQWLIDEERVYPVSIDPSVIVSGGIEEAEVQYGGLQRKVAYVNGNWYAFYNCDATTCTASTGGRIFYKKSSDGVSWGSAVAVDDSDTDNFNPSIAVSNNIIHVWWIDDGADRAEGRRIDTGSSDAQGTLCQTSIEAGAIGNTFMISVAQFSDTGVLIAYSDTTGGDAEINAFEIASLDGTCTGNLTSVVTGNVTFGTQGAGLTSGDRPVLVGLDSTSAAVMFQDGTDLSFAKYDATRDEWRRNNQTIASVTDTIYSVTTDGTNIWVLSVDTSTNQNTRLYSCCTDDLAEFLIDSDTGESGDEQETEMDIWCPASDPANCKVVYVDNLHTMGPDLMFVDCDDENCSTFGSGTPRVIDSDTGSSTNAPSPALFCVTSGNCKIAHGDLLGGTSPDMSLIDCNDETCSAPSQGDINGDLGGSTSKPNTSLYCLSDTDCKVVFFEDDTDDLWFADCSNANCSTRDALTAISLNINTTNSNAKNSIWCPAADDCKILYHDAVEGDLTLIDCSSTTCGSRTELDIDTDVGGTSVNVPNAIDCTSGANDCKLIYADGSQLEFNFVDCGDATCSTSTTTKIDDTAGGLTTFGVDLDCQNGASDCKGVYVGDTSSPEDQYFFDCDNATCSSGSVMDLDNPPTRSALSCPASANCKLVYYDALESSQPPVYFADCDREDCLPTWTDQPDPWTSQTNITSVSLSYDSANSDLYAHVIKDSTEQAYFKSTDATTISWGTESSYGFTAGDLGHISASEKGAGPDQIGVVLRQGTNFEFAVVPEKTLILLMVLPIFPKILSFLKRKKTRVLSLKFK